MANDGEKLASGRAVLAKTRARLERAGEVGLDQLRRTSGRLSEAVGSAAEQLKDVHPTEKLSDALEVRRAIRRAAESEARSDFEAAFRALEGAVASHPGDPRLALVFWRAAVACGRPADAAEALLHAIRTLAAGDDVGAAAGFWTHLVALLPDQRADAGSLLRMVPSLLRLGASHARTALRHALDPETHGMTPGLAVRAVEYARELDPTTALRAAELALAAPDLHEKRRAKLHGLVVELGREIAHAPSASPSAASSASAERTAADVVGELAPLDVLPPDLNPS